MTTLAEIGIRNRVAAGDGILKATYKTANACAFVWTWAQTTRKLGRHPTQPEHGAEWKISLSTVEREVRRFRDVYGEEADLQAVADFVNAWAEEKMADQARVLEAPAPSFLAGAIA